MIAFSFDLITMTAIFAIAACALNLLIGVTGIFSIAHAVFFGLGAYTAGLVATYISPSILLAGLISIPVAALVSLLLSVPASRVTGVYFAVASLAFQVVGYAVFHNWDRVTGGPSGLTIPPQMIFSRTINHEYGYLITSLVALFVIIPVLYFVVNFLPFGRALKALRDDQEAAKAVGKNPFRLRVISVAISASICSLAGVIYAGYLGYVGAASFSPDVSVLLIAMVVLGGTGTTFGPVIGAAFITIFPALLTFLPIDPAILGPLQRIIYGCALAVLMIVRPAGLSSAFEPFYQLAKNITVRKERS